MTPSSDRERIDALERKNETLRNAWQTSESDRRQLLDRLAALEHERDESLHSPVLQAVLAAIKGTIDTSTNIADHPNVKFAQMERLKLEQRAEQAEAAFLRLQTAVQAISEDLTLEGYDIQRALRAALLPDPAGTTTP